MGWRGSWPVRDARWEERGAKLTAERTGTMTYFIFLLPAEAQAVKTHEYRMAGNNTQYGNKQPGIFYTRPAA